MQTEILAEHLVDPDHIFIWSISNGIRIKTRLSNTLISVYCDIIPLTVAQQFLQWLQSNIQNMHNLIVLDFNMDDNMYQFIDINNIQKPENLRQVHLNTLENIDPNFLSNITSLKLERIDTTHLDKLPNILKVLRIVSLNTEISASYIQEICPNIKYITTGPYCILDNYEN